MPEQKIPLELTKDALTLSVVVSFTLKAIQTPKARQDLLSALVREGTVSSETGSACASVICHKVLDITGPARCQACETHRNCNVEVLVFLPTWSIMSVLSKLVEVGRPHMQGTFWAHVVPVSQCAQADEVLGKSCKVIMLHSQAGMRHVACG